MFKNDNWIIPATFLFCALFFLRTNSLFVNDTYWHMSVGREVVQTKKIPVQDNFVYGSTDTHYVSSEWLSGLIYYEAYTKLGSYAFPLLRLLIGTVAIFFLYKSLLLVTKDKFLLGTSLFVVSYVISFSLNNRPEMFSIAFIAITNYVCISYYWQKVLPKTAYLLPLIFLAWPNIHPYPIIGLGLLAFFAFLVTYQQKFKNSQRKNYLTFTLLVLISAFLSALQYQRIFIFAHASNLQYIAELVSLKDRILHQGSYRVLGAINGEIYLYFLVTAIYLFNLIKTRKIDLVNVFYLAILLSPIKYFRLISPVLLLVWPLFTLSFKNVAKNINAGILFKTSYLTALVFVVISVLTGQILGLGKENPNVFSSQRTDKFIKENLNTKRIFTVGNWNDYYIWNLENVKTFSDAMPQFRTKQSLLDENFLVRPDNNPQQLISKYNIDTIINTQTTFDWQSSTNVAGLNNWQLVYISEFAIIYARKDVIKNNILDLSLINPYEKSDLKFDQKNKEKAIEQIKNLLNYDTKNDFARIQLVMYYIYENQLESAEKLALESKKISENKSGYSYLLAIIYATKHECQKAKEFARETILYSPQNNTLKQQINDLVGKNCPA